MTTTAVHVREILAHVRAALEIERHRNQHYCTLQGYALDRDPTADEWSAAGLTATKQGDEFIVRLAR